MGVLTPRWIVVVFVGLVGLAACGEPEDSERAYAADGPWGCVDDRLCRADDCLPDDAMLSILACQCDQLRPACGPGACDRGAYREGDGCDAPADFEPSSAVAQAMCRDVLPPSCAAAAPTFCQGNSLCDSNGVCHPAAMPISVLACACNQLNPSCGLGTCVGGMYCEGAGCALAPCHPVASDISLAMCGGVALSGCAIACNPPADEVAHWPLDETRTTSSYTIEWNPDAQSGADRSNFSWAIQYLAPRKDVTSIGFSDDWTGWWSPSGSEVPAIELFDSTTSQWVNVLPPAPQPAAGRIFYGTRLPVVPTVGLATAIRFAGYTAVNVPSTAISFGNFVGGTMFLHSDEPALRPKDVAARNNGTATDTLRYATPSGPDGPTATSGMVGGALGFDGAGDVVIAPLHYDDATPGLRANHSVVDLTIEAWINPAQLSGTPRTILAFVEAETATAPAALVYALRLVGNQLAFEMPVSTLPGVVSSTTASIAASTWHHVAVVAAAASQQVTFYVDGVNVGAVSGYFPASAGPGDQWQIGSDWIGAAVPSFDGVLDEVKVYERALAGAELAAIYAAGGDGTCQRGLLMAAPHNGAVFEGKNAQRMVNTFGYATVPGQAVEIQGYDTASATWTTLATTTASGFPDAATGLYTWFALVTPAPTALSPLWREIGLGWLRVTGSNGSFVGASVDDPLCLARNLDQGVAGADLITNCRGDLGAMTTVVDSDVQGQQPYDPPVTPITVMQQLGNNMIANIGFLWRKVVNAQVGGGYYTQAAAAGAGQPRHTLAGWKQINGFPASDEVRAVYFNAGDLRIGRDMHCRRVMASDGVWPVVPLCSSSSPNANVVVRVACYVGNYFQPPPGPQLTAFIQGVGGPAGLALHNAINQIDIQAAVAMEALFYDPGLPFSCTSANATMAATAANRVRFYAYGFNSPTPGSLLHDVAFDSEGAKSVPGACLSCHGGSVSANGLTDLAGASFIAFDVGSFFYSTQPGFTYSAQEDAFRQLNEMVRDTSPTVGVTALIDGFYDQQDLAGAPTHTVATPNAPANFDYTPRGWAGYETTYEHVPRRSCRTCHLSQPAVQWPRFGDFAASSALAAACATPSQRPYMPQAQVPYKDFWRHGHRADLVNARMTFQPCAP